MSSSIRIACHGTKKQRKPGGDNRPTKSGAIGLDPYGVTAPAHEIGGRGITDDMITGIGQGTHLSPVIWGLEKRLKDGTFLHGAQELMTWSVGNCIEVQR